MVDLIALHSLMAHLAIWEWLRFLRNSYINSASPKELGSYYSYLRDDPHRFPTFFSTRQDGQYWTKHMRGTAGDLDFQ